MGGFFRQMSHGFGLVFSSVRIVPGFVYLIVFIIAAIFLWGGFGVSSWLSTAIGGWASESLDGWSLSSSLPSWLLCGLSGAVSVMTWLLSILLWGLLSGSIILVLLSPLLTHVADKTWIRFGGSLPREGFVETLHSILRGILVALRYCLFQLFLLLVVFVLGFVPVAGFLTPFLGVAVNAFFYGASFADYAAERAGVDSHKALSFSNAHRGLMIGLGLPFAAVLLLPFVGKFIAIFLAPVIAAAGSRALIELKNEDRL